MRPYLIFTLEALLASYGTIAVGERRPTWDRPSKSQIDGFLAAALGIERSEEQRQQALTRSTSLAVRVDDPGRLLQDYHTTQRPDDVAVRRRQKAGRPIKTRRDELDFRREDLHTGLSRREYRSDAAYTVAVWLNENAAVSLDQLKRAIEAPAFHLCAGRKANCLIFPCSPVVAPPCADILAAFDAFDAADAQRRKLREAWTPSWLNDRRRKAARTLFADEKVELPPSLHIERREERRDVPLDRANWRFVRRTEAVIELPVRTEVRP